MTIYTRHAGRPPECLGLRFAQTYGSIHTRNVVFNRDGDDSWLRRCRASHLDCFISFVILLGVVFLAMPLSTVGNNFTKVWEERQLIKLQAVIRQLLFENGIENSDCLTAFNLIRTENGLIDANEFTYFVTKILGLKLDRPSISKLWRMLDINNTGAINFVEFASILFRRPKTRWRPPTLPPHNASRSTRRSEMLLPRLSCVERPDGAWPD